MSTVSIHIDASLADAARVAAKLVRPLFLDQWPTQALLHLAVLAAYAGVAFWVALALTRKRFSR
jgi:lipooligosaccharide transport system permease protein